MDRIKFYALCAAIAGLTYLFPLSAFSIQEIEFYVTNQSSSERCFQCSGPFSRHSRRVSVPGRGGSSYFYTADVSSLSPYGRWFCQVFFIDNCFDDGPVSEEDTITQGIFIPPGEASVSLIINGTGPGDTTISVSFQGLGAVDGTPVSVTSFLGDDPRPGKGDNDTFSFEAEAGDEVTITLEPDPSAGHTGDAAGLRLRRRLGDSGQVIKQELPIEMTVTIPETGTYEIVMQSDVPDNMLSYRGGYILKLDSASGSISHLHPSPNVEN